MMTCQISSHMQRKFAESRLWPFSRTGCTSIKAPFIASQVILPAFLFHLMDTPQNRKLTFVVHKTFLSSLTRLKQIKSAGIQHIIATIHALNIEDVLQYVTLSKRLGVTINFSLISFTSSDPHTAGLIPSPSQLYSLGDALFHLGSDSMAGPHGQTRLNISAKRYCGAAKKHAQY